MPYTIYNCNHIDNGISWCTSMAMSWMDLVWALLAYGKWKQKHELRSLMTIYLCLSLTLRALGMSLVSRFPSDQRVRPRNGRPLSSSCGEFEQEKLTIAIQRFEMQAIFHDLSGLGRSHRKRVWIWGNLTKSVWFVTPSPEAKVCQSSWILWSCCQLSRRRCHGGTKTMQSMMQSWWLLEKNHESIDFNTATHPTRWILLLSCNLQDVLGFASGRICVDDFPVWVWTSVYPPTQSAALSPNVFH